MGCRPRALACLVSRDSELAYLFRSLIKLSPPPPHSLPPFFLYQFFDGAVIYDCWWCVVLLLVGFIR